MQADPILALEFQPTLVIDGSSSRIFAGVLKNDRWLSSQHTEGNALESLFTTVEKTLIEASTHLNQIGAYIYNAGPGSVLGLRLTAMALETWGQLYPESRNFFAYNSLQFSMRLIQKDQPDLKEALLISDWKKNTWNAIYLEDGIVSDPGVASTEEITSYKGTVFHLPQRKGWQSPPEHAATLAFEPERINEVYRQNSLLKNSQGIELYASAINTFQKWTPDRHRATSL